MIYFKIVRNGEENFSWISNVTFEVKVMGLLRTDVHYHSVKDLLMEKGLALREEIINGKVLEERKIFRWLPPAFPTTAKFRGVVHHVDWRGRLYVTAHPEATREKDKIDTALLAAHNDILPGLDTCGWEEGEACIARYFLDGDW